MPQDTPADPPAAAVTGTRTLMPRMAAVAVVICVGLLLVVRRSPTGVPAGPAEGSGFTQVGREGPVFTVSVPRSRASDDEFLMKVAERLSSEDAKAGGSGQVSVMIWPDDVPVPRVPPTTEFDSSMRTQAAGIFINPKLNIRHLIRFRDGTTEAERDFGARAE